MFSYPQGGTGSAAPSAAVPQMYEGQPAPVVGAFGGSPASSHSIAGYGEVPVGNVQPAYGTADGREMQGWAGLDASAGQQAGVVDGVEETDPAYVEPDVRWSWGTYPVSWIDSVKLRVPLGCMYTPLRKPLHVLSAVPDKCSKCFGFINPFVSVDYPSQTWTCCLCGTRNMISNRYGGAVSPQYLPPVLQAGNETAEFVEFEGVPPNIVFLLLVDTCLDNEKELEGLKSCLQMVVERLPPEAYVCLITFSIAIQFHDLSGTFTAAPHSSFLRGSEEVKVEQLKSFIPNLEAYVQPLSACRTILTELIDDLERDPWPVPKTQRPLRCTGAALSAATSALEVFSPGRGSCILSFLSGACTVGPGMIVQPSRELMFRSHTDIKTHSSNSSLWFASCAFYDELMRRIVAQGHTFFCFCASLDQLGIAEMKQCIYCSGGVVLNAETWGQEPFRQSIRLLLNSAESLGDPLNESAPASLQYFALNATLDVITSPTWKVAGVIGQCVGTGKKNSSISNKEIGAGGTSQWTTGFVDTNTTYAIYFHASSAAGQPIGPFRYAQFITRYERGKEVRIRVTTVCHPQKDKPTKYEMIRSFDQETAVVLLAREAMHKTDSMPIADVVRWLDGHLINIVAEFGEKNPSGVEPPIKLPQELVFLPAFVYHLRRSGYLQLFNSSPDESAIIRLQLLKSNVQDSIIQIQPTLYRYRMDAPPQPVALDSSALQHDCIVLLDTFFEVLLHCGSTIAAWRNAGYAEQEDYAYFKEFLDVAMGDAETLVLNRAPVPRLIHVNQDDPDARILYNRINPSRSYNSMQDGFGAPGGQDNHDGDLIYTDDSSLQSFVNHLWKKAAAK